MGTMTRRMRLALGLLAAIVLGLPAAAEAQLFPRLPIRRERTPCCEEPPVYKLYRHQYHGYFPTCWRRFPPGWGCPSPEAPSLAASIAAEPLQTKPLTEPDAESDIDFPPLDEGDMEARPADPDAMPEPGRDEPSPFELRPDRRPPADPDAIPPAGTPPANLDAPGLPDSPVAPPPTTSLPGPAETLPSIEAPPSPLPGPTSATPARAPQRRGLLSGLLSGRGRVRR